MELIYTLDNIEAAAQEFIGITGAFKVFALEGEMGAGKTTFVHALCKIAGVTDAISSPTFSISFLFAQSLY